MMAVNRFTSNGKKTFSIVFQRKKLFSIAENECLLRKSWNVLANKNWWFQYVDERQRKKGKSLNILFWTLPIYRLPLTVRVIHKWVMRLTLMINDFMYLYKCLSTLAYSKGVVIETETKARKNKFHLGFNKSFPSSSYQNWNIFNVRAFSCLPASLFHQNIHRKKKTFLPNDREWKRKFIKEKRKPKQWIKAWKIFTFRDISTTTSVCSKITLK
jgi:hypothetical protein